MRNILLILFAQVILNCGFSIGSSLDLDQAFEDLDLDNDGLIDYSEFQSFDWQTGCFNEDGYETGTGGNGDDDDDDLDIIDCVDVEDKSSDSANPEWYSCDAIETISIDDISCSASSKKKTCS